MGRKFIIMEIEGVYEAEYETKRCCPVNAKQGELLFVHKDSIIDEDRLRYGSPKGGDIFFSNRLRWCASGFPFDDTRLILDPPPDERSAHEKWLDDVPKWVHESTQMSQLIDWFKRMPPREE